MSIRIKKLTIGDKIFSDSVSIKTELHNNLISWLDTPEIENAILEIKNDKLYWVSGTWYFGDTKWMIWLDGTFLYGTWNDGVFYNGKFVDGTCNGGIFMNGEIMNGSFKDTEFRKGVTIRNGEFKNCVMDDCTFLNGKIL